MIRNYLQVAIRSLLRQRLFSVVNILGLSIGMASAILILLWVQDEKSFDAFHSDLESIYRVYEIQTYASGDPLHTYSTPGPLAEALIDDYPEIISTTRFHDIGEDVVVGFKDKVFYEPEGYLTDPDVFKIFHFEFLQGDPGEALTQPQTIVVNRTLAEKYFGPDWSQTEIVGEMLLLDGQWSYQIAGVVEDFPANSLFQFDFLVPFKAIEDIWGWKEGYLDWGNNYTATYVLLEKQADVATLGEKIKGIVKTKNEGSVVDLYLTPLNRVYLYPLDGQGGRIQYLRIFSLMALFILVIACINFTNLATAKAGLRSKEVGIRKTVGAFKSQLVFQFLLESVLMAVIALMLALVITLTILPYFNELTDKSMTLDTPTSGFYGWLVLVTILTGIVAGIYPAFYMSSFRPSRVLKGFVGVKGAAFRKTLVVIQFVLSGILIVCSLVVFSQLNLIQNKEIGFSKENLIHFSIRNDFNKRFELLKNEFANRPEIINTASAQSLPINHYYSTSNVEWPEKDPDSDLLIHFFIVGYDFVETLGIEFAEGGGFSPERNDSAHFIVNQTLLELMGKESGLNEEISMWGTRGSIIGVVKDFDFKNAGHQVEPAIMKLDLNNSGTVVIRIDGQDLGKSLATVEEVWAKVCPDLPFQYQFLDQDFDELYKSEERTND